MRNETKVAAYKALSEIRDFLADAPAEPQIGNFEEREYTSFTSTNFTVELGGLNSITFSFHQAKKDAK